jgi:hypothetical protein
MTPSAWGNHGLHGLLLERREKRKSKRNAEIHSHVFTQTPATTSVLRTHTPYSNLHKRLYTQTHTHAKRPLHVSKRTTPLTQPCTLTHIFKHMHPITHTLINTQSLIHALSRMPNEMHACIHTYKHTLLLTHTPHPHTCIYTYTFTHAHAHSTIRTTHQTQTLEHTCSRFSQHDAQGIQLQANHALAIGGAVPALRSTNAP